MIAAASLRSREILVCEDASRLKAPLRPIKDTGVKSRYGRSNGARMK